MRSCDLKIFTKIPTLETERLILRRIMPSDAEDVYSYSSDPAVSHQLLWHPHTSRQQTRDYLKLVDKKYKQGQFWDFGVVIKEDLRFIGTVGFTSFDFYNNSAEIGYVLSSLYWGRGLAAEAARAVITFGFEVLGLNRIEARFTVENARSRRVLKKCGMTFEGVEREGMLIKGEYRNIEIYSILKSDYKKLTEKGI